VRWPWRRRDQPEALISIADPVLAEYFNVGNPNYSGVTVGEGSALGLSAVYRAGSLIAGTIASLPMRTLRDTGDGQRQRMGSFLDNPGGPDGPTRFEWTETVMLHLLLHGNAFLAHQYSGAGALAALAPIHPLCVSVELPRPDDDVQPVGGKWFRANLDDNTQRTFDARTLTHIPALSTDGVLGLSPIAVARNSLGTAIAGDRAAAKLFSKGALMSGMVTPEDDLEEDEMKAVKEGLNRNVAGWENAGDIAVVNRRLKFTPWTMSAQDAQFLESRQFQVEEIARWYGVPPHLLMQTSKQTSWGTGVEEQNRGLARHTLMPWTTRIEQRLSRLLPNPRFVEFDYAGYLKPAPADEIRLLLEQIAGGLLTLNEARAIRNLPPVDGGDEVRRAGEREPAQA
jgi:HK97 family phage portal protein